MPIFDYLCLDCRKTSEVITTGRADRVACPVCGSQNLEKLLSAHSSYSGSAKSRMPGPGDSTCCGSSPAGAGCAGPGSCCGKH